MATSLVASTPPKMTVTNIDTNEEFEMQFNPSELAIVARTVWAKVTIPGLSHQPKHFITTENLKTQFSLTWRLTDDTADGDALLINGATNFFLSLTIPISVTNPQPPRVLFVWPTFISLECTVDEVQIKPSRFSNRSAQPIELVMDIQIEEIRQARILSNQVRLSGMRRASVV